MNDGVDVGVDEGRSLQAPFWYLLSFHFDSADLEFLLQLLLSK